MVIKTHVKKGDEVVVIAGNSRESRGTVLQVFPRKDRVLVEGVNIRKFHEKARSQEEQGGIHEREAPIHISNVMLAEKYDKKRGITAPAGEPGAESTPESAPEGEA